MVSNSADNPLDSLLDGKSDDFKGKVLMLSRRLGIDESDPTFLLLAGTSTLEALLEQYPQEFEALFKQLLASMEGSWQELQQQWEKAAEANQQAAQTVADQVGQIALVAEAECEKIRQQAGTQAELLDRVHQQQVEKLQAETQKLTVECMAIAQERATEQMKEVTQRRRWAHYLEAFGFVCLTAALLSSTSWFLGWRSRGYTERESIWTDIERWNGDELKACQQAKTGICEFQIEIPEEKKE